MNEWQAPELASCRKKLKKILRTSSRRILTTHAHLSCSFKNLYFWQLFHYLQSRHFRECVCASLCSSFSVPVELCRFFSNTRELEIWVGKEGWWEFQGLLFNLKNAERKRATVWEKAREEQRGQGSEAQASGRRSGEQTHKGMWRGARTAAKKFSYYSYYNLPERNQWKQFTNNQWNGLH
jgi:hypothetical protein